MKNKTLDLGNYMPKHKNRAYTFVPMVSKLKKSS